MTATNVPPRTAAQINARLSAIGAELAKGWIRPVPNARQLEAEETALKIELRAAEDREGEAAAIAERVKKARHAREVEARQARIDKAVADAMR